MKGPLSPRFFKALRAQADWRLCFRGKLRFFWLEIIMIIIMIIAVMVTWRPHSSIELYFLVKCSFNTHCLTHWGHIFGQDCWWVCDLDLLLRSKISSVDLVLTISTYWLLKWVFFLHLQDWVSSGVWAVSAGQVQTLLTELISTSGRFTLSSQIVPQLHQMTMTINKYKFFR